MEIRLAENSDLSGWVRLVEPMRHLFPGLETRRAWRAMPGTLPEPFPGGGALCCGKRSDLRGAGLFPGGK